MTEFYKISKDTLDDIADTIREMNPNAPQDMSGEDFATYIRGISDSSLQSFVSNTLTKAIVHGDIKDQLFYGKSALTEVTIDDGATIGLQPFFNTSLKKLIGKPRVLKDNALSGCSLLEEADFSGVVSVGSSAFANCYKLEEISMPLCNTYTGTSTSAGVFAGCTNLKRINIPLLNTGTREYVFNSCSNLEFVYMPSMTSIGYYAFRNTTKPLEIYCPNITTIYSVTGMKDNTKLYLGNEVKITSNLSTNWNYYVPTGAKQTYVDAWGSTYESKIFEYNPTFTIDGVEYTSTGGSWTNWLSTSLNTLGLIAKGNNIVDSNGNMLKVGNQYVSPNDYVEAYPYVMGV